MEFRNMDILVVANGTVAQLQHEFVWFTAASALPLQMA